MEFFQYLRQYATGELRRLIEEMDAANARKADFSECLQIMDEISGLIRSIIK